METLNTKVSKLQAKKWKFFFCHIFFGRLKAKNSLQAKFCTPTMQQFLQVLRFQVLIDVNKWHSHNLLEPQSLLLGAIFSNAALDFHPVLILDSVWLHVKVRARASLFRWICVHVCVECVLASLKQQESSWSSPGKKYVSRDKSYTQTWLD